MAITKPLVTTTVVILHQNDPVQFTDAVDNGKVTRDGTNAKYQILHGDTVHGKNTNGDEMVIPYHAVVLASVTVDDSDPINEPEDAFCVADGGSDGGGK